MTLITGFPWGPQNPCCHGTRVPRQLSQAAGLIREWGTEGWMGGLSLLFQDKNLSDWGSTPGVGLIFPPISPHLFSHSIHPYCGIPFPFFHSPYWTIIQCDILTDGLSMAAPAVAQHQGGPSPGHRHPGSVEPGASSSICFDAIEIRHLYVVSWGLLTVKRLYIWKRHICNDRSLRVRRSWCVFIPFEFGN